MRVKVKQSHHRPRGFQEVEAPRFQDNRHMKVVRLSALRTGRLYPQEIILVLISVIGWPQGLCQWKIPMTPSGIEHATFRLAAQCLNQLRYGVSRSTCRWLLYNIRKYTIILRRGVVGGQFSIRCDVISVFFRNCVPCNRRKLSNNVYYFLNGDLDKKVFDVVLLDHRLG